MKTLKKLSALLIAVLLVTMVLAPAAAFAEDTTYTPVAGTSTSFQKALILDENANVPDLTFTYAIAAGAAVAASDGKMEVISPSAATGVTGTPTVDSADYNPGDATVTTAEGVTIAAGQKAALKTLTVDFSGVSFAEPGIYRYLITETSADQQGVTYDTQLADAANGVSKQRTLDVYVTDDNGSLAVSQYVIHELVNDVTAGADNGSADAASAGAALTDKSKGFVNELTTYDLSLSKTVSGNQGSHDKYFQFTVAITNAGANAALNVDWSDAQHAPAKSAATIYAAADMAAANAADDNATIDGAQWVCDASGSVTKTVYLKHDQSIVIKGLASGAKWTITEAAEDYKSTAEHDTETAGMAADTTAAFTNTRNGVVPTGVMLTVVPGVVIVAVALLGLVALKRKKDEA